MNRGPTEDTVGAINRSIRLPRPPSSANISRKRHESVMNIVMVSGPKRLLVKGALQRT